MQTGGDLWAGRVGPLLGSALSARGPRGRALRSARGPPGVLCDASGRVTPPTWRPPHESDLDLHQALIRSAATADGRARVQSWRPGIRALSGTDRDDTIRRGGGSMETVPTRRSQATTKDVARSKVEPRSGEKAVAVAPPAQGITFVDEVHGDRVALERKCCGGGETTSGADVHHTAIDGLSGPATA